MLDLSPRWEAAEHKVVGDPALRLWFDERECGPVSVEGTTYTFVVPPACMQVRVVSRVGHADAAVEGGAPLGVAIGRICLRSAQGIREIALDHPKLEHGLYTCEREGTTMWRWTDGDARLPVELFEHDGCPPALIEIHLHGKLLTYRID